MFQEFLKRAVRLELKISRMQIISPGKSVGRGGREAVQIPQCQKDDSRRQKGNTLRDTSQTIGIIADIDTQVSISYVLQRFPYYISFGVFAIDSYGGASSVGISCAGKFIPLSRSIS